MDTSPTAVSRINKWSRKDYQSVLFNLHKALKNPASGRLGQIQFPEFSSDVSLEAGLYQLEEAFEKLIIGVVERPETFAQKIKATLKRWFETSYPFVKLFLNIAKE